MNAVVEVNPGGIVQTGGRMAVADVIEHVATVQQIMQRVMKPEVHYGKIPGAGDKPVLLKPGAELLCMTFRIADSYRIEDLSRDGMIRYRVTCVGKHQGSNIVLGEGVGECSSDEEKYRWRKAVCKEEIEATPESMRRRKFARGKGGSHYTVDQIRTEPADIANTVLKMANKRAKIAMVLNVTAASDMFSQDLEDLDESLRETLAERENKAPHDPELAASLVRAAGAAKTVEALQKVWKDALPVIKAAGDTMTYNLLKPVVEARLTALKAAAEAPVEQEQVQQDPPEAGDGTEREPDPWLAEMDAEEAGNADR